MKKGIIWSLLISIYSMFAVLILWNKCLKDTKEVEYLYGYSYWMKD